MSALSNILGIHPASITGALRSPPLYRIIEIRPRTRGRKVRRVLSPHEELKAVQKAILDKILSVAAPHPAATAFFKGRSIAYNARQHHNRPHLYKTDISNFFESVKAEQVHRTLERRLPHLAPRAVGEIVQLTTHEGVLPQGAPTSPHLANLVLYDFDDRITRLCARVGARYTRYADDIAVSASEREILVLLDEIVRSGLMELGLAQHPGKTRFLGPQCRKLVTGLDVTCETIRPPRSYRKKAAALVRMCAIYPSRMKRSAPRVMGYLSHWHSIAPDDPELMRLKKKLGQVPWDWSNKNRTETGETKPTPPPVQATTTAGETQRIRAVPDFDDIPF